jgi:hypothetical protein
MVEVCEPGSTVAADTLLLLKEETRGILTLTCETQKDADDLARAALDSA